MQVLFVHSVHNRVCQKELLLCGVAASTATEHGGRPFAFSQSLSEVSSVQGLGLLGVNREENILVAF